MKKPCLLVSMAVLACTLCLGAEEITLRPELSLLKPLVGKTWTGETKDPSGRMTLRMLLKYEAIHNGKTLKYSHETKELNNRNDGYVYYDPDKKEISFLTLNSNGNISVGIIKEEGGKILKSGYSIFPDRKLEFRSTLEITPDGKLLDKYFRFQDGQWMAGHSVAYSAEPPRGSGPYLGQKPPGTTPELFAPGIISTGLDEALCAFTPENDEIVFNLIYHKPHSAKVHSALVRSFIRNGAWTHPELMEFQGDGYAYLYPFIGYDGKDLYFQSDMPTHRPELKDKYNIWRCRRNGDGWGEPEPLPPPINGRGDVSGPSMSQAGEFFFTLMSGQPERDGIYRSQYRNGAFSEPERLPESVNVKQGSFDGVVSPDGSYYIVNVYRKDDSLGETDLYVSFRDKQGVWTPLKNLGPAVNSKLNEGSARISADGRYVFFTGYLGNQRFFGDRPTYDDILNNRLKPQFGNSDIYWVSVQLIEALRPKE